MSQPRGGRAGGNPPRASRVFDAGAGGYKGGGSNSVGSGGTGGFAVGGGGAGASDVRRSAPAPNSALAGVLAQEAEQVYPKLVSTDPQGYKAVNHAQLTPILIEALKEQQPQIEALKAQNSTLKVEATATTEAFEARLRRLEGGSEGQARG